MTHHTGSSQHCVPTGKAHRRQLSALTRHLPGGQEHSRVIPTGSDGLPTLFYTVTAQARPGEMGCMLTGSHCGSCHAAAATMAGCEHPPQHAAEQQHHSCGSASMPGCICTARSTWLTPVTAQSIAKTLGPHTLHSQGTQEAQRHRRARHR